MAGGNGDGDALHRTWLHSERYIPRRFIRPIQSFMDIEAASGVVLLAAAIAAVWWANSPFRDSYESILASEVSLGIGGFRFADTVHHLINDGLMVIFFYVVGLEIKRELVLGELRDRRAAMLPVMAALGGMVVPIAIYLAYNAGTGEGARGWGVPVATDIAFAVGVLALLGRRVPAAAKLFLLALAIVDDLGGILLIAIFYTEDLALDWLGASIGLLVLVAVASRVGIRSHIVYFPLAIIIWYSFVRSGIHSTVAGVALAFLTPARPMYSVAELDEKARSILETFPANEDTALARERSEYEASQLAQISRESVAPLVRNEHTLNRWSSFLVIPLFALANAGVHFGEVGIGDALTSRVALGVMLGLVIGKTAGITLFSWLAIRTGLGRLPAGTGWRQLVGTAAVAGIGFTVALFIASLAFTDDTVINQAKVGIFAGSLIAGVVGSALLWSAGGRRDNIVEAVATE
jgi:Na+:H+ antiporter, NhaA family